jgi:hypothetical protein
LPIAFAFHPLCKNLDTAVKKSKRFVAIGPIYAFKSHAADTGRNNTQFVEILRSHWTFWGKAELNIT